MFSASVVATQQRLLEQAVGFPLVRHAHDDCWAMQATLAPVLDKKGTFTRPLTEEESLFVFHEQLLCKVDFRYFAERYAIVAKETQDAEPLFPLWASQELFLARLADSEAAKAQTGAPDGLLVNVLKARQLGISTIAEVILAHRLLTQTALRGLVGADTPEQSKYLFSMAELVVESVPWWLRPPVRAHQTGSLLVIGDGQDTSTVRVAAGKSQRGGLQERGGTKGNIGRGKTFNAVHISEVSTWERPDQLYDGLLPGVPRRTRSFCVFESTAKGRNDEWHQHWTSTANGLTRFTNIFIPWYIEPDKYWDVAPEGWEPSSEAKLHAAAVERDSPKWCRGQTIRLSREQLYWWDRTRAEFDARDQLNKFKEEWPATDLEAFQHGGQSVFSARTLDRLVAHAKPPVVMLHVRPNRELANQAAWERAEAQRGPG